MPFYEVSVRMHADETILVEADDEDTAYEIGADEIVADNEAELIIDDVKIRPTEKPEHRRYYSASTGRWVFP